MYAELMGNHKKQRIKSHCDNKIDVEMGTSRMRAQPFLEPAMTEHLSEYKEMIETILKG